MTTASNNPANFANLPKDELREIAAKGGHASHGSHTDDTTVSSVILLRHQYLHVLQSQDRNPDGTFTKGSELAKELGAKGGHIAHEHQLKEQEKEDSGVSHCNHAFHLKRS